MNTESEIRKSMARKRHRKAKAKQSLLSRLTLEVNTPSEDDLQLKARQAIAQHRQQKGRIQESMLGRSEAELEVSDESVEE